MLQVYRALGSSQPARGSPVCVLPPLSFSPMPLPFVRHEVGKNPVDAVITKVPLYVSVVYADNIRIRVFGRAHKFGPLTFMK